jgi:hypothetical protein
MINSDETTIANASSNPDSYLFRKAYKKYKPEFINKKDAVKPSISIMFWAGIWMTGRTPILFMPNDETQQNGRITNLIYRRTLEQGLLPHYNGTRKIIPQFTLQGLLQIGCLSTELSS